ncbi:MAG: hypothetical protein ACOYLB_06465 [Phototrophicaceae bacterium]
MTTQPPNMVNHEHTTQRAVSAPPTSRQQPLIPLPPSQQGLPPPRPSRRAPTTPTRPLPIALILLVLLLIFLVLGLAILIVYAPNAFDPYIPGRLSTRTQVAQFIQETEGALQSVAQQLAQERTQAVYDLALTATALEQGSNTRATENALRVLHTVIALEQTATYGAYQLDVTRTASALQVRFSDATASANAFHFSMTQTQVARPTLAPVWLPTASGDEIIIPLAETVLYADTFDNGLASLWVQRGAWATTNGKAYSAICGTDITVSVPTRSHFAVEFTAENHTAQYAVQLGYGEQTHLWVNFGLGGAVWWLSDSGLTVSDATIPNAYDATRSNRVRVEVRERVVSVFMNGNPLVSRELSLPVTSPVGIYTCPTADGIPLFDDFTLLALP